VKSQNSQIKLWYIFGKIGALGDYQMHSSGVLARLSFDDGDQLNAENKLGFQGVREIKEPKKEDSVSLLVSCISRATGLSKRIRSGS